MTLFLKSFNPLIIFIMVQMFFYSCKKEKDKTPPSVSVNSPYENESFAVFDTILVKAQISDETHLKSVSAQVLQENLTPALRLISRTPSDKNYTLQIGYPIDDSQLSSGNYYVCISASDGVNESRGYVKIFIRESATAPQGIVIVSEKNFNTVDVSILDNNNSLQPFVTLTSDYSSSCVSSKNQIINILGKQSGGLNSYKVETKSMNCNIPAPGTVPYFNHLDFYNEISYVCFRDGKIRGYDKNCATQFSAITNAGFTPLKSFLHNAVLIVEEDEISGPQRRISVYYGTGAYNKSIPVSMDVVAFAKKDDNRIFLFGNENGMGKILLYNISNNDLFSPYSISDGIISDAVQINSNTYLLALPDGIYKYNYSPVNFIKHINASNIEKLKYDSATNRVIASSAKTLKIFDYNNGQQLSSYTHSYAILDIHFLNNK